MGTRSLTIFKEEDGAEICVMYRQMDGYPAGHGNELSGFLSNMRINGLSCEGDESVANGMSCLAAQVVSYFKKGAGSFYLYPAETRGAGEDYLYYISGKAGDKEPTIRVCESVGGYGDKPLEEKTLFEGLASDVMAWTDKQ